MVDFTRDFRVFIHCLFPCSHGKGDEQIFFKAQGKEEEDLSDEKEDGTTDKEEEEEEEIELARLSLELFRENSKFYLKLVYNS